MTSQSTLCEVGEMTRNEQEKLFHQWTEFAWFLLWRHFPQLALDEDIKQEALLGLWKACRTYDKDKSQFSTYAAQCILNQVRQVLRKRSYEPDIVSLSTPVGGYEEEGLTLENMLEDPVPSIDEGYIDLKDFLRGLNERDKKLIQLRLQGKTQKQIAQEMGLAQSYCSRLITKIWVDYTERRNEDEQEN